jgi:hypothetical protein
MASRKDVKSVRLERAMDLEPDDLGAEELGPETDKMPAGRIIHDDRGNAVWKWAGDTSATGGGSGILKHLDPNDLAVEGHTDTLSAPRASTGKISDAGGGYDPYNQGHPRTRSAAPKKSGGSKR